MLSYFILAISSSIDSLGLGITYGIKNTKITIFAKIILFFTSLLFSSISISIGNLINNFFPSVVCNILSFLILFLMGVWIIVQAFNTSSKQKDISRASKNKKIYKFFIKSLGITIQIIKNPVNSDLDNSKKIEAREALYLSLALSLDSLCIGIGNSVMGNTSFIFPLLVATFQFIFLSIGLLFGKKINRVTNIPDNIWSIISGFLLIFISILKLI